jgi:hypothetical protein
MLPAPDMAKVLFGRTFDRHLEPARTHAAVHRSVACEKVMLCVARAPGLQAFSCVVFSLGVLDSEH